MKIIIFIFTLSISFISYGQSCDTIQDKVINCIDENGLNQGHWEHWKYEWRQKGYNSEIIGFCQTTPLIKVPIKLLSRGKYLDGKKVKKWEYINDRGDEFSISRTEYYYEDGSIDIQEDSYQTHYNNDSLWVKSIVFTPTDTVNINCRNKLCVARYVKNKFLEFKLDMLDVEIDKIRWGIYTRELQILKEEE